MIHHYLFKKILFFLLFFIIIPVSIMWIVQVRTIIDLALDNNIDMSVFFKLSLYILPPLLPYLLPLAFILTSIYVLYLLHRDSEWVIFWGTGKTPLDLAKPFLWMGVFLSLIILVINFWLAPHSKKNFKQEVFLIKKNLVQSLLKPQIFQSPTKDIKVYIKDIEHQSQMKGFFIEDRSDKNLYKNFTAEEAFFIDNQGQSRILLLNGKIHLMPTDKKIQPSMVFFKRFTLDINMLGDKQYEQMRPKIKDYDFFMLIDRLKKAEPDIRKKIWKYIHSLIISALNPIIMIFIFIVGFIRPLPPRFFPKYRIFSVIGMTSCFKVFETYLVDISSKNDAAMFILYIISLLPILYGIYYLQKSSLRFNQ